MIFYGNILVSVHSFCKYIQSERRAHAVSLGFVATSQILLLFACWCVTNKILGYDPVPWLINQYVLVTLLIGWMIAVSYYYTLARVESIYEEYEQKTDTQKLIWGIIALLAIIIPFVMIATFSPVQN